MSRCDPDIQRIYEPDQDAMLSALARILRFKPPDDSCPANNETTSDKLAGDTLMVSETTAEPAEGDESRD